jgi:ActR/RegA family two-component response regulator
LAETIVLIVDDLMFSPRLEETLNELGYQPLVATNEAELTQALRAAPVLVITDLFSQ